MLFSLFKNVGITAAAFFAISVVGLLLVPIVIAAYGLTGLGLIAMGRFFLPTAALAVLDFGVGEYATQSVAGARFSSEHGRCGGQLVIALSTAVVSGALGGLALFFVSTYLSLWLSVPPGDQEAFTGVIRVTALVLPVLFASQVFEGVIKGFENFAAQRICEVVVSLAYAAIVLGVISMGWGFQAVCYALLVSLMLRTGIAFAFAWWSLRGWALQPLAWHATDRADFLLRARLMFFNKVLGTAQTQAAPVLIAALLGVTAVGVFDALTRLPRFAKSILGLLSSTILPVAAKLESVSDQKNMRRLGETGVLIVGLLALPPLAAGMVFSKPVLEIWLSGALTHYWHWQAAMFLIPALSVIVGFGATALIVRPQATSAMNRLVFLQIALQFGLSLALVNFMQERAFILGQIVAVAITFIWQMRLLALELNTSSNAYWRLMRIALICLALVLPGTLIQRWIEGPVSLGAAIMLWTMAVWLACFAGVLDTGQRAHLHSFLVAKIASIRTKR
jgi:O-antigen/teichoic acid export membrane protein